MSDIDKLQDAEEWASQQDDLKKEAEQKALNDKLTASSIKETPTKVKEWKSVSIKDITPLPNIRVEMSDIQSLAISIKERGLITPLIVRPSEAPGKYELIAGARRMEALQMLQYEEAMCEVIHELDEAEAYELMFTENIQRQDLPPLQAAKALQFIAGLNKDLSVKQLSQSLGLELAWVKKHLNLLSLPKEVQESIDSGDLSFSTGEIIRRGIKAERLKEKDAIEAVKKLKAGEINLQEVKSLATPPPKTKPLIESEGGSEETEEKSLIADSNLNTGKDDKRLTPNSQQSGVDTMIKSVMEEMPQPYYSMSNNVIDVEFNEDQTVGAPQEYIDIPPVNQSELKMKADRYLLLRALQEWAFEDYLANQDIPKDSIVDYVNSHDNPMEQLRHLTVWLMMAEGKLPKGDS